MSEETNDPNNMLIDLRKKFIATERRLKETMDENKMLKSQRENLKKRLKDHPKLIQENKALSAKLKANKVSMARLKDKNYSNTEKLKSKLHRSELEIFKLTRPNETLTNPRFSKKKNGYKPRKRLVEDNQKLSSEIESLMGKLYDFIR